MTSRRPARSVLSTTSTTQTKQQPLSLSRRLLFPTLPVTQELPPLLASDVLTPELYHLIALALRAFVNPWWTKITRYDKDLLPEINRILAVVLRMLEARIVGTDLSPLVYQDIPALVTQHYEDVRTAQSKLGTSYAGAGSAALSTSFHQQQPHIALDVNGHVDELYIRQVVDHILKACLPEEDYGPEAERFIVREIVVKIIVKDIIPKITEPWFLYKTILDLLGPAAEDQLLSEPVPTATSMFSFHALLVFLLSTIQSISGTALVVINSYKHIKSIVKSVNQAPPRTFSHARPYKSSSNLSSSSSSSLSSSSSPPQRPVKPVDSPPRQQPEYAYLPLLLLSTVFTLPSRSPSSALLNLLTLLTTLFTPFLDKLLPYLLYTHVLNQVNLGMVVKLTTTTLFPNGYPATPPLIPTEEEQKVIREELLRRIAFLPSSPQTSSLPSSSVQKPPFVLDTTPIFIRLLLGPTPSARLQTAASALEGLSDSACNAHLVVVLMDALILRIFPELGIGANGGDGGGVDLGGVSRSTSSAEAISITPPGSVHGHL